MEISAGGTFRGTCLRFRAELILLLALGFVALARDINTPPLLDWDEATYAQVAHESLESGRYLDFTWNGEPYLKKPPLLFWILAASFKVFGESEFAARVPSVALALGTLLIIYLSATSVGDRLAGTFAGLFPLTFYFFVARGGRECATDSPLIFSITLAMYGLLRARTNRDWLAIAGVGCGLAFLSKGAAGLIPVFIAVVAVSALPAFRGIAASGLLVMTSGAAVVSGPWYVYQALFSYPLFVSTFLGHETLQRVISHLEDDIRPGSSTLRTLLFEARYLWPLLLPLIGLSTARLRKGLCSGLRSLDPAVSLWLVWLLVALLAACVVQTKLAWYVLPALIPLALLGGTLLATALRQRRPFRSYPVLLATAAVFVMLATLPQRWRAIEETAQVERARSGPSYKLAMRARQVAGTHGGGELYFAGVPLPTLVYYSRMRCHFVETSELEYIELIGAESPPARIRFHDLVLLDPKGGAYTVANLDREWYQPAGSGPSDPDLDPFDTSASASAD